MQDSAIHTLIAVRVRIGVKSIMQIILKMAEKKDEVAKIEGIKASAGKAI